MAFRCRKIATLLSSSYIEAFQFRNPAMRNSCNLLVTRFASYFVKTGRHFSTGGGHTHSDPQIVSYKPGEEVAKDNNLEFQIWYNGGGMFHKSALIDPSAVIEISAIVHSESVLGPDVHVGSGTVIGPAVTIGQSTRIGYNVALTNCTIGDFCVFHNGVSIGQDGFGFFVNEQGQMVKKPQNLKARIGNHVEIGANTCIDRGSWRDTAIGDHTKIDNLVQIGHNVLIGKSCMLCGQVGIAGSATIGDYVTLGGRVAIRDHVCISSKVRLAANSFVTKNISEAGDYGGFPAVPIREWRKQVVTFRQISKGASHKT